MSKHPFLICNIIFVTVAVVIGNLSLGAIVFGLVIGSAAGVVVLAVQSSRETSKRRKQRYPIKEEYRDQGELLKKLQGDITHPNLENIDEDEDGNVVVSTKKCTYTLTLEDGQLTINESLKPSKAVMYSLLFRPSPPIILAKDARLFIPYIIKTVGREEEFNDQKVVSA